MEGTPPFTPRTSSKITIPIPEATVTIRSPHRILTFPHLHTPLHTRRINTPPAPLLSALQGEDFPPGSAVLCTAFHFSQEGMHSFSTPHINEPDIGDPGSHKARSAWLAYRQLSNFPLSALHFSVVAVLATRVLNRLLFHAAHSLQLAGKPLCLVALLNLSISHYMISPLYWRGSDHVSLLSASRSTQSSPAQFTCLYTKDTFSQPAASAFSKPHSSRIPYFKKANLE